MGGRRAPEILESGVVLESLANLLGALGTDVVAAKAERDARGWQRSVRPRVGGAASKPARGRAHARKTLHGRGRAGGRRALELLERGVVLERLANVLRALVTDCCRQG